MAKIDEIAKLLKVQSTSFNNIENKKNIGKKRRAWLLDNSDNGSNNVLNNKLGNKLDNSLGNSLGDLGNKLDNSLGNSLGDLGNKLDNSLGNIDDFKKITFTLSTLQKSKKTIFLYLLKICISNGTCNTGPIQSQKIASETNIPYKSFKTILNRLININVIRRNPGKTSSSGYIDVYVSNIVKELSILYYKLDNSLDNSLGNFITTSSSSNIYIKTTTTGEPENEDRKQFSEKWLNLDIEPLAAINFTKIHLTQIASQEKLTPQLVQESIYAFAFDLENNKKRETIKGDPLNYFMGILRNGKPYLPPSNYESPQDRAMRLYLERAREIEQNRTKAEEEAINLAFNEWFTQLTDNQKLEFLPEIMRREARLGKNNKMLEGSAKVHFREKVWPERLAEILNDNNDEVQPNPKREEVNEEITVDQ